MRWTEREIELLKELYSDKSVSKKEVIERLGRTWNGIRNKARELNLELRTDVNYWTEEDVKKLKELNKESHLTSKDIGRVLNRSSGSVRVKLYELEIKRPKKEKSEFVLNNIEDHLHD